ncbi:DNA-binding transcriptional regulator [Synergistales bacterium]|nr:DNA-binding transcriptional regulator [Synergistales bacterium]
MAVNWKDSLTDKLCDAFLQLKTPNEMYAFLEDVATIGEVKALAQRLEVARLLSESKTYPQIAQHTGASTATISRVKKFLDYGAGGYKIVLDRLKKPEDDSSAPSAVVPERPKRKSAVKGAAE